MYSWKCPWFWYVFVGGVCSVCQFVIPFVFWSSTCWHEVSNKQLDKKVSVSKLIVHLIVFFFFSCFLLYGFTCPSYLQEAGHHEDALGLFHAAKHFCDPQCSRGLLRGLHGFAEKGFGCFYCFSLICVNNFMVLIYNLYCFLTDVCVIVILMKWHFAAKLAFKQKEQFLVCGFPVWMCLALYSKSRSFFSIGKSLSLSILFCSHWHEHGRKALASIASSVFFNLRQIRVTTKLGQLVILWRSLPTQMAHAIPVSFGLLPTGVPKMTAISVTLSIPCPRKTGDQGKRSEMPSRKDSLSFSWFQTRKKDINYCRKRRQNAPSYGAWSFLSNKLSTFFGCWVFGVFISRPFW